MTAKWHNFHGYRLDCTRTTFWCWIWPVQHYEYSAGEPYPLTLEIDGQFLQPDRHVADTDLGSVPPPLRSLFPHTETPRAYVFHDSGYRYGGLWRAAALAGPYEFLPMDRDEVDDVLHVGSRAESIAMGVSEARAARRAKLVHSALERCGGWAWRRYRAAEGANQ